jgi:hypothetical protein
MVLFIGSVRAAPIQGGKEEPFMHKRQHQRPGPEPEWESVADTAKATGLSRAWVYEKIARGHFDAVKDGKRLLVNIASRRAHYASLPKAVITPRKAYSKPAAISDATA